MKKRINWEQFSESQERHDFIMISLIVKNEIRITSLEFERIIGQSPNDFFKCSCCEHEKRNKVNFVEFVHALELNCPVEKDNVLYIPFHIWADNVEDQ